MTLLCVAFANIPGTITGCHAFDHDIFFLMILVSLFYNYTIVTLIFGGSLEIFVLSFIFTLLQNNSNKNNVFIIYLPLLKFKIPGCGLFRGFFPDYHKEYTAVSKGCSLLLSTRPLSF